MQKSRFGRLRHLVSGIAVVALLAGCSTQGATPDSSNTTSPDANASSAPLAPVSGGSVAVGAYSEMKGFDPIGLGTPGTGIERATQVMDSLLYQDLDTGDIHPRLAESMESTDGKVWVLKLREGINFTDGEPLNADAVIFNTERHLAEDSTSSAKSLLSVIETMEKTSDLEVTFTLKQPDGFFPIALSGSSAAGLVGSPKALADPVAFNEAPVGAGAFKVTEWVRDSHLVMERNDDYYREGLPYLDKLEFKIIPDNKTRTDSLLSNEIDIAVMNAEFWGQVENADGFVLYPSYLNGATGLMPNNSTGPGSDIRFRQALQKAFNPDVTAQVLIPGSNVWNGSLECMPFSATSGACAPGKYPQFDLEGAKQLIEDYKADGGSTSVTLTHFQSLGNMASFVQQQLAEIGLDITLNSVDAAGLGAATTSGEYELMMTQTALNGYTPTVWQRFNSTSPTNWPKTEYPELQEQVNLARAALTTEDRDAAWREINTFVYENAVVAWFAPMTSSVGANDTLHLGDDEFPYVGSTAPLFDSAWKDAN